MDHIAYLSQEIGPRPSGTEEEQQAALYITDRLKKDARLTASIEDFNCETNPNLPKIICNAVSVVALILAMIVPSLSLSAAIASALAAVIVIFESLDRPIISQLLPTGISQNVVGKYDPPRDPKSGSARRRKVIIVANYDSGKSRIDLMQPFLGLHRFTDIAVLVASVAIPVILLIGGISSGGEDSGGGMGSAIRVILIVIMLSSVAIFVGEQLSAYNEAANCNAAGVAVMLEVARRLGRDEVSTESQMDAQAVMHDEETAYEAGVVPEGATVHYEEEDFGLGSDLVSPEDLPTGEFSLTAAPAPESERMYDIAENLVQVREEPVPVPDQDMVNQAAQDTVAAFSSAITGVIVGTAQNEQVQAEIQVMDAEPLNTSVSAAQTAVLDLNPDGAKERAAEAVLREEEERRRAEEEERLRIAEEERRRAEEERIRLEEEMRRAEEERLRAEKEKTPSVPDWYKKATEKARLKAERSGSGEDSEVYRSRYADFPGSGDTGEGDSKNKAHEGVGGITAGAVASAGLGAAASAAKAGASSAGGAAVIGASASAAPNKVNLPEKPTLLSGRVQASSSKEAQESSVGSVRSASADPIIDVAQAGMAVTTNSPKAVPLAEHTVNHTHDAGVYTSLTPDPSVQESVRPSAASVMGDKATPVTEGGVAAAPSGPAATAAIPPEVSAGIASNERSAAESLPVSDVQTASTPLVNSSGGVATSFDTPLNPQSVSHIPSETASEPASEPRSSTSQPAMHNPPSGKVFVQAEQPDSTTAMSPLESAGNLDLEALRAVARGGMTGMRDAVHSQPHMDETASPSSLPQMMYYTPPLERPEVLRDRAQKNRVVVSAEGLEQAAVMDVAENSDERRYEFSLRTITVKDDEPYEQAMPEVEASSTHESRDEQLQDTFFPDEGSSVQVMRDKEKTQYPHTEQGSDISGVPTFEGQYGKVSSYQPSETSRTAYAVAGQDGADAQASLDQLYGETSHVIQPASEEPYEQSAEERLYGEHTPENPLHKTSQDAQENSAYEGQFSVDLSFDAAPSSRGGVPSLENIPSPSDLPAENSELIQGVASAERGVGARSISSNENNGAARRVATNIPMVDLPSLDVSPGVNADLQPVSFEDFRQHSASNNTASKKADTPENAVKQQLASSLPSLDISSLDAVRPSDIGTKRRLNSMIPNPAAEVASASTVSDLSTGTRRSASIPNPAARSLNIPDVSAAPSLSSIPSISGKTPNVSLTGSFAAIEAVGAQPVGDELLDGVALDDIYVDDADDSAFSEEFTETGAFAGPGYVEMPQSRMGRLFGRFRRKKDEESQMSAQEWLGVGEDFDARAVGKARGSWDSFREDDVTWNGGAFNSNRIQVGSEEELTEEVPVKKEEQQEASPARSDRVTADAFAAVAAIAASKASEAREEEQAQAEEVEEVYSFAAGGINTEVWFVALGSELANHGGIRAFLAHHASDMRGAIIVNLEALGAGRLSYIEREGILKQVGCSPRIKRILRKAAQTSRTDVASATIDWRESPASFAMRHRVQSVTIAGMDGKKPALYCEAEDLIEHIDEQSLTKAADFVVEILKNI